MTHRGLFRFLAGLVLGIVWVSTPSTGPVRAQNGGSTESEVAGLEAANRARDSVVKVVTYYAGDQVGGGTGIVIAPETVLTNNHVVLDVVRLAVLSGNPGDFDAYDAEVLRVSERLDLALLRVPGLAAPPIRFNDADPVQGQLVVAWGYPGVLEGDVVGTESIEQIARTQGTVIKVDNSSWGAPRSIYTIRAVFHDALIRGGNSGGPVVDGCGRLIGVNTQGPLSPITVVDEEGETTITDREGNVVVGLQTEPISEASSTPEILPFLRRAGVAVEIAGAACAAATTGGVRTVVERVTETGKAPIELWIAIGAVGLLALTSLYLVLRHPQVVVAAGAALSQGVSQALGAGRRRPAGWRLSGGGLDVTLSRAMLDPDADGFVIGTEAALCDRVLDDDAISARHTRFTVRAGYLYVEDLNSESGTEVASAHLHPFRPVRVDPGSEIRIGRLKVRIEPAG